MFLTGYIMLDQRKNQQMFYEELHHLLERRRSQNYHNPALEHLIRTSHRDCVEKSIPKNANKSNAIYISIKARKLLNEGNQDLVADHMIPLSQSLQIVKQSNVTVQELYEHCVEYASKALITKDEDRMLRDAGLVKKLPNNWPGPELLARYDYVGITVSEI